MIRLPHEMPATPAAAEALDLCAYRYARSIHDALPPSQSELMAAKFKARAAMFVNATGAAESDDQIDLPKSDQSEVDGWLNTFGAGIKVDKFTREAGAIWELDDPESPGRTLGVVVIDLLLSNDKQAVAVLLDCHTSGKHKQLGEGTFAKPGKIKQERGTSIPKDLRSRWVLRALRGLAPKSNKYKVAVYYARSGHWCETSWIDSDKASAATHATDAEIATIWTQLNGELVATACSLCPTCRYVTAPNGGDGSCPYWLAEEEKKRRVMEFQAGTRPSEALAGHQAKADPPPPRKPEDGPEPIPANAMSETGGQHQGILWWKTSVGYTFGGPLSLMPLVGQNWTRADALRHIEASMDRLRGIACTQLIEHLGRRSINIACNSGILCRHVGTEADDAHALMGAIEKSAPPAVVAEIREHLRVTGWTLIANTPGDRIVANWQPGPMFAQPHPPPEPDNGIRHEADESIPDGTSECEACGAIMRPDDPERKCMTCRVASERETLPLYKADAPDDDDPTIPPHPAPEMTEQPKPSPIRLRKPVADAYFKLLVAGPPKTFKTRGVLKAFASNDPEHPTLIAEDLDDGTKFYADEFGFRRFEIERAPNVFTIPESPDEIIGCFRGMINNLPPGFTTLMIDPLSVLVEALKKKWALWCMREYDRSAPYLAASDWNLVYGELNEIFAACRRASHNVVVVSHVKDQYAKGKKRSLSDLEIVGLTADAGKNCEAWFDTIVYIEKHASGRLDAQTVGDRSYRLPPGGKFWEWSENSLRDALFGGGVQTWEPVAEQPTTEIPSDAEVVDVKTDELPGVEDYVATPRTPKPGDSELANRNSEGAKTRTADRPAPAATTEPQKVYEPPTAEAIMQKWFDEVWSGGETRLPSGAKHADGGRNSQGTITEAQKNKFAAFALANGVNGDRMRQYMRRVLKDDRINGPSQLSEDEARTMIEFFASMPF